MKISNKEFEVLVALERDRKKIPQRELVNITNMSLGTINKVISDLLKNKLIDDDGITEKGIKALEPFRVKRAIFLIATYFTVIFTFLYHNAVYVAALSTLSVTSLSHL